VPRPKRIRTYDSHMLDCGAELDLGCASDDRIGSPRMDLRPRDKLSAEGAGDGTLAHAGALSHGVGATGVRRHYTGEDPSHDSVGSGAASVGLTAPSVSAPSRCGTFRAAR
jgi:hypothetical protein